MQRDRATPRTELRRSGEVWPADLLALQRSRLRPCCPVPELLTPGTAPILADVLGVQGRTDDPRGQPMSASERTAGDLAGLDQALAAMRDVFDAAGVNIADPEQLLAIKMTAALLGETFARHGRLGLRVFLEWTKEL